MYNHTMNVPSLVIDLDEVALLYVEYYEILFSQNVCFMQITKASVEHKHVDDPLPVTGKGSSKCLWLILASDLSNIYFYISLSCC